MDMSGCLLRGVDLDFPVGVNRGGYYYDVQSIPILQLVCSFLRAVFAQVVCSLLRPVFAHKWCARRMMI